MPKNKKPGKHQSPGRHQFMPNISIKSKSMTSTTGKQSGLKNISMPFIFC